MTNEQFHREAINQSGFEMLLLCKKQLEKAKNSLYNFDSDLAEEVMRAENHVNALDIKIDKDCERFLALYTPVAVDLRFITSIRNINSDLERIGDHAYGIAKYVTQLDAKIPNHLFTAVQLKEAFDIVDTMFDCITESYESKDIKIARKVFKKDKKIDTIDAEVFNRVATEIKKDNAVIGDALILFSIIKKLERVGDLLKNIAEDIIFYVDAEVLRHKKKK